MPLLTGSALVSLCPSNASLTMVFSKYHNVQHCICPPHHVCIGVQCSVGEVSNGGLYSHEVHGFRRFCVGCSCRYAPPPTMLPRDIPMVWIIGTHRRAGSFMMRDMWKALRKLVDPPLKVHVDVGKPLLESEWRALPSDLEVIVKFNAHNIGADIEDWVGREYKFVHIYRDPVDMVVSSYLYETQRFHKMDVYNKVIQRHGNGLDALTEMLEMMMELDIRPMYEQFVSVEADYNALNVKYEDFVLHFEDTVRRIFAFLGLPTSYTSMFLEEAQLFDSTKYPVIDKEHVTAGKYDTAPLVDFVFNNAVYHDELVSLRKLLRYS